MSIPQWQQGVVQQIEQATPNTRRFWIALPETPSFHFKPGQFVTLDLPIHENRNKRWRSYSIASAPDGGNVIELVVVRLDGGLGSCYLCDEIKPGDTLTLRGPQGIFTMPEVIDRDLVLICTGTGIAPFRSMVQHIRNAKISHGNIHLVFGTRTREDLLYAEEMWALEQELSGFKFYPTLSREDWNHEKGEGYRGYVHEVYERICSDMQPANFMLCGWKVMIDEAKERILKMGYDKKDIHLELYG